MSMADRVHRELDAMDEPGTRQTAQAFGATLFGPAGLDGNLESYYAPDNSYISSVLDTRKGIPISLSTVGILVAKRLGLPVVGIGMPTHFLLGFEREGGHVLIDPFNRGSIITPVSCKLRLEQIGRDLEGLVSGAGSDQNHVAQDRGQSVPRVPAER